MAADVRLERDAQVHLCQPCRDGDHERCGPGPGAIGACWCACSIPDDAGTFIGRWSCTVTARSFRQDPNYPADRGYAELTVAGALGGHEPDGGAPSRRPS